MTRDTLTLRRDEPIPLVTLRTLPCRVCGATSDAPVVILPDGPSAYCTLDHAVLHGWPWLRSERAPEAVAGQSSLFSVPND